MTGNEARAAALLRVAAGFIREKAEGAAVHYHGVSSDAACLARDCELAAEDLGGGRE